MEYYALPTLVNYTIVNVIFDLWMNRTRIDIFSLVINFIDDVWVPRHVTIGLFEAFNSTRATFVKIVKLFLVEFQLIEKIISYVEDGKSNQNTLATTLFIVVSCVPLQLVNPFVSWCFRDVNFIKVCYYATNNAKVCICRGEVSLKVAQQVL
jgi:hypothetical protein